MWGRQVASWTTCAKGNTSLGGITYLVLDEVDEMLRQGFGEDIETLLSLMPQPHQTMMCSATLDEEVRKLGKMITKNPRLIDIDPKGSDGIDHPPGLHQSK